MKRSVTPSERCKPAAGRLWLTLGISAFSLLVLLGGCTSDFSRGSKQVLRNLTVSANLLENGDMTVSETWKVDLKDRGKAYRNLYRTFPLESGKADGVTDLAVTDEDRKVSYSYAGDVDPESVSGDEMEDRSYIHRSGSQLEIGWFMPAVDEGTRTFTVSYRIRNIIGVYADTAVLYHAFVPQNFSLPVASLNGTVRFPKAGSRNQVRAWLHTTARSHMDVVSAGQISFTASEIPAKTLAEVRLCVPPGLFPNSAKVSNQSVLSGIEAQESKWAADYEAKLKKQFQLGILDAAGGVLLLAAGVGFFIWLRRKNRRHRVDAPEYTRDIPQGSSPGGVANLFYFYSGLGEKEKNRMFSATLLSLARKKFVRFENNGEKKSAFSVVLEEPAPETAVLTESEQVFYNLISDAAQANGGRFSMKEFRRYAEKNAESVHRRMEDFLDAAKREITGRGYYEAKPVLFNLSAVAGVVLLCAAAVVFFGTGAGGVLFVYLPLAAVVSGVLLLVGAASRPRLSERGEKEYAVWHGLKKFMLEFSRMKEYGVPQLELWEEYLVYATMMGISGEVCKQLRLAYPQLNDDSYVSGNFAGSYLYYMFGPRIYWGGLSPMRGGFDFGSVLGNTFGQIGSAATRLSNPAMHGDNGKFGGGFGNFGGGGFGGGGFGGGGGGFGAGGGGGVR